MQAEYTITNVQCIKSIQVAAGRTIPQAGKWVCSISDSHVLINFLFISIKPYKSGMLSTEHVNKTRTYDQQNTP